MAEEKPENSAAENAAAESEETKAPEAAEPALEASEIGSEPTSEKAPEQKKPEAEVPAAENKGAAPEKKPAASEDKAPAKSERDKKDDPFLSIEGDEAESKPKIIKAKGSKNVAKGIVHITATFNNTIVSFSDLNGNVLSWASSGKMGFKGSRKSTAYAAQLVSQDACRKAMSHGLREVEVRVKGPGAGREAAVRAIQALGVDITVIRDVTPIPHNGCRPPKARRV